MKTLYKLDSKKKLRQWSIDVINNGDYSIVQIISGLVDGEKVEQSLAVREGKNLGKKNETTPYTQALAEADSRLEQQLRKGYVHDIDQVRDSGTLGSGLPNPMLAHKYDKTLKQSNSKNFAKLKPKAGETYYISPKLDGIRGPIVTTPDSATLYTRKGDVSKVQPKHFLDSVLESRRKLFPDNEDTIIVDGEVYVNPEEMAFTDLNGQLNRKDSQDINEINKIQWHIYDIFLDKPYRERYEIIKGFQSDCVKLVECVEIEPDEEVVEEYLEKYLDQGYEGAIIRKLDTPYENKRTWSLLKVKVFEEEELELLDIEPEPQREGRIKAFIMKLPEPTLDRDGKIKETVRAGVKNFTEEQQTDILANKEEYIGTMCTIEYFGKSKYNIHRHPKMKLLNRTDI